MSQFFDQASLVMVPSGYKDGKVYSQKPLSTDGELTFSRGSDIEATRVASNGYIEKAKVNLLLQSNSFDTTWTNTDTSETSGQAGYDGSSDAWLLTTNGVNGFENITQSINFTGVHTLSIYAKQGTNVYLEFRSLTSDFRIRYKLDDGTHTTQSGSPIDTFMDSVGGGWYRCGFTANFSGATAVVIYPQQVGVADAGNIYLQDAQLNYGLVAQDYVETTTTSVVSGITNDMPRLDYSGGASCPSLLLEPSRTNIQSYSEYFGGSYYVKGSGVSVVDNNYTSPEGVLNGAKLTGAIGTTRSGDVITRVMSVSSSTTYTASIYVYKDTATQCTLYLRDGSTGVVVSESVTLEEGWQRIDKSITTGASTSQMNWYLGNTDGDIGIYGAQIESGAYSTSYIPTYGTSATRTADAASKTGISSLIGQTEGTLFADVIINGIQNAYSNIINSEKNTTNSFYIHLGLDGIIRAGIFANSVQREITASGYSANQRLKIAFAYKTGDLALYVNGVQKATSASSFTFNSSLDDIFLNDPTTYFGFQENVSINQTLLFKTRLSDSDLATLTA